MQAIYIAASEDKIKARKKNASLLRLGVSLGLRCQDRNLETAAGGHKKRGLLSACAWACEKNKRRQLIHNQKGRFIFAKLRNCN